MPYQAAADLHAAASAVSTPASVSTGLPEPDLSGMSAAGLRESLPVFRYLFGRYQRVVSFDEHGNAQLVFSISSGRLKGWHAVMIEPFLLSRPIQRRPNNAFKGRRAKRARLNDQHLVDQLGVARVVHVHVAGGFVVIEVTVGGEALRHGAQHVAPQVVERAQLFEHVARGTRARRKARKRDRAADDRAIAVHAAFALPAVTSPL